MTEQCRYEEKLWFIIKNKSFLEPMIAGHELGYMTNGVLYKMFLYKLQLAWGETELGIMDVNV